MIPLIAALKDEHTCGLGTLTVERAGKRAALPLAAVDVRARVADRIASVTLTEKFQNPYAEPLEATYIFPLSGGAAVSAFEMRVADRIIRGKVEERGAARAKYQRAVDQGKRAALLEQERDDVFTVHVGNLPPREEISVTITYSERLAFFEDGTTEIRLPLVVAPRYIPGTPLDREPVGEGVEWDTDAVPDASRITPPRLAPGFDPKVALSVEVDLADGEVADLCCSQHAVRAANGRIALAREDEPLDRDFVLRWRLAKESTRSTLLIHGDAAMLSIVPPRREGFLGTARDVVFLLDRSGSMSGVKMTSAARACAMLLGTLGPRDRFAIQAFDDQVEWLEPKFVAADEAGLQRGERFLRSIEARGGTELDGALGAALGALPRDPGRSGVVVLLTDGQVGDESRILRRIQGELGDARVFCVGIDTAVNEGFLKRLASLGGGTSTFVVPGEALETALRSVGREIGEPLIIDLEVEGAEAMTPSRAPDLFAGRAVTVYFRAPSKSVRVRGRRQDGSMFEETVAAREVDIPALGHLWARSRVADLEDRFRMEPGSQDAIRKEIVEVAVRHTLLTRFTAFVVVDESEVVNPEGRLRKIVQPVEMPARWEMETAAKQMVFGGAMPVCPSPAATGAGFAPAAPPKAYGLRKADECKKGSDSKPVSASERKDVERAVRALFNALDAAREEIEAGRVPAAEPLEKTRADLMKLLAASELGLRMAALQRFLRSALVQILAALRTPGISAVEVRRVWDRHARAIKEATPGTGKAFWEETV